MPDHASGVLLHPTSLPGGYGVGDLGPAAHNFLDLLSDARVSVWQLLPVSAPGAFESPYDCRSAFAGNWLLISPEALVAEGLLQESAAIPGPSPERIDFAAARKHKEALLRASWDHFHRHATPSWHESFDRFLEARPQRLWLADWALFSALEDRLGEPWSRWPEPLRRRSPEALVSARRDLADEIGFRSYQQFLFFHQFEALRTHARQKGVRLCGDLPMYVSHHSADTWARPDLFELDDRGLPCAVAGVPPDAFSVTGQLWGSPVYRWPQHRRLGFDWWVERLRIQTALTDMLRLDHFRGFLAYWRVPAAARDASEGRWVRGPGLRLFAALTEHLGELDLIAEDLGHITGPVHHLRGQLGLPGMKVLQFAFGEDDSDHLPEHFEQRSVAYTGTHDNDTLVGWFEALDQEARKRVLGYLDLSEPADSRRVAGALIRIALESEAELAIVPMQDLLGLGREGRMNTPGTVDGNWSWRMQSGSDARGALEQLRRPGEASA